MKCVFVFVCGSRLMFVVAIALLEGLHSPSFAQPAPTSPVKTASVKTASVKTASVKTSPVKTTAIRPTAVTSRLGSKPSTIIAPHNRDIVLPPPSFKPTAANPIDFRCRIRIGQQWTAGYVATEIVVDAIGTFAAQRDIVVRFQGVDDAVSPPQRNLVVDVPVRLSQGNKSSVVVRYLPRWAVTRESIIEVIEDGRLITGYQAGIAHRPIDNPVYNPRGLRSPPMPVVDAAFTTEVSFDPLMIVDGLNDNVSAKLNSQLAISNPETVPLSESEQRNALSLSRFIQRPLDVHPQSELPTDWRAFSPFDSIVVSSELLEGLAERKQEMDAIRQWVMMGGTILIVAADDSEPTMQSLEIDRILDEEWNVAAGKAAESVADVWKLNEQSIRSYLAHAEQAKMDQNDPDWLYAFPYQYISNNSYFPRSRVSLEENIETLKKDLELVQTATSRSADQWNDQIWYQRAGAGRVIGIRLESPDDHVQIPDLQIAEQLISFRLSPMLRRGVDPMIGDARFRELLIPGVAQPPVYTFIGLLTAFVILVGPVAYRFTTRSGRGYLMFAIAPVLAFATTGLMFVYGIISDGFGTSARIRQVTFVNAASRSGVERIRGTYFAGVRPSDDLQFLGSDEVMGYPESQGQSWEYQMQFSPETIGRTTVAENQQSFSPSFLPSRRQTQFVVHRARPSIGAVSLTIDGRGQAAVTNGYDFPLRRMVIRANNNTHWLVKQVAAGATSEAVEAKDEEKSEFVSNLYTEFRAIMATKSQTNRDRNTNQTYDLIRETMQSVSPETTMFDGSFELDLRSFLQTKQQIPAGHFIAISDVSDDAAVIEDVAKVDCIRYVFGTYRLANEEDSDDQSADGSEPGGDR